MHLSYTKYFSSQTDYNNSLFITFRVSRRPREMYCGHARLCVCVSVCLSAAARPHYCTDPDVTWGSGRGCPLVVHYWADLQSVHGMRCYGNFWKCVAEPSGNPPGPPHAARTTHAHAPAIKSMRLLLCDVMCNEAVPFRPYCAGVATRTRNVSEYMLVLTLCLVINI